MSSSTLLSFLCAILVLVGVGGIIWSMVEMSRAERRRRDGFQARAAELGWVPADLDGLDEAFRPLVRFRPPALVLAHDDLLMTWHHWTEVHRVNGRSRVHTHDRLAFLARVTGVADLNVVRRTPIGRLVSSRRGLGTGDARFDLMYAVKPADDPAAVGAIGPALQDALVAERLPMFAVRGGVVSIQVQAPPSAGLLDWGPPRVAEIARRLGG